MKKGNYTGLKLLIIGLILFGFCVGITFLWYRVFQRDKVAITNLTIALKDKGKGVDVESLVPMNDRDAKDVPAYSFDIMNNGDTNGRYEVLIEDGIKRDRDGYQVYDLLSRDQLRYELILNGKVIAKDSLSKVKNNILDTRVIGANKTNSYSLRIWIPFDAEDWQNKTYHYKVVVNTINEGEK